MLHNKDGRGGRVPRGQAWQWTHNIENLEHLGSILDWIDLRVSVDHLSLLNVYLDHTEITAPHHEAISFASKSQILYSKVTMPNRVIDMSLIAAHTPVHGHTFLDLNVLRRTL
jgi:hypothetical protein